MQFCCSCGQALPPRAAFCPKCGVKVEPLPQPTPASSPVVAEVQIVECQTVKNQTVERQTVDSRIADCQTVEDRTADPQTADPQTADPQTVDPQTADRQTADRPTADRRVVSQAVVRPAIPTIQEQIARYQAMQAAKASAPPPPRVPQNRATCRLQKRQRLRAQRRQTPPFPP